MPAKSPNTEGLHTLAGIYKVNLSACIWIGLIVLGSAWQLAWEWAAP